MAKVGDIRSAANRIRSATESLVDPRDQAVVRDYLRELENLAIQQEAEDARRAANPGWTSRPSP